MAYRGGHFSNLTIPSFPQHKLKPPNRNGLAKSNRNGSRRERRVRIKESRLCRFRPPAIDDNPSSKSLKRGVIGNSLNLNPIRSRVFEFWVGPAMVDFVVVREQEEPFAFCVESADGVHLTRKGAEVFQRRVFSIRRELGENAVGFVEEIVVLHEPEGNKNPPVDAEGLLACFFKRVLNLRPQFLPLPPSTHLRPSI